MIIRDQSAQRTIGGGKVLDIFPPVRGRAKPARLAYLAAMNNDDAPSMFSSLLQTMPLGLNLARLAQNRNLTAEEAGQLFASSPTTQVATLAGMVGYSRDHGNRLKTAFVGALTSLHRRTPNVIANEETVLLEAGLRLPKEIASSLAAELISEGAVVREPMGVRLRTHVAQLSPADAVLWKRIDPLLKENILRPPSVHEIALALAMDPKKTESLLVRVSRLGWLVRVADNRFFEPAGLRRLAAAVEEIAPANHGSVTAGQLRDHTGIGRTVAIDVLEYFDRIKFTRRVGNDHQVLCAARTVFGGGDDG